MGSYLLAGGLKRWGAFPGARIGSTAGVPLNAVSSAKVGPPAMKTRPW